jgi:hypothetical protein
LRPRRLLVILAALALAAPATAHASGAAVIRDCTDDGHLSKTYSQKDYRDALKNIPTDVNEYTDCRDVIRRAQLGVAGGGSSSGGGGGGTGGGGTAGGGGAAPPPDPLQTATPQERKAVETARDQGGKPVSVAGEVIKPIALGYGNLGSLNTLPTPLIIVCILLALGTVAAAATFVRSRVLARRNQP